MVGSETIVELRKKIIMEKKKEKETVYIRKETKTSSTKDWSRCNYNVYAEARRIAKFGKLTGYCC